MLLQLSDRGPDSAGVAVYRDPRSVRRVQGVAVRPARLQDWDGVRAALDEAFGGRLSPSCAAAMR